MATRSSRSPFDRLRQHYEHKEHKCIKCGYIDTDTHWRVTKRGHEIHYQHICPSCGNVDTRVLRYGER
ncbi:MULTISPECIES: HVO_0649 family zinc finger protein [unclassified Haladaptatus]|uniref:HVO_0649 family zinc finger protein n=1 Tax=unclassified Haladaptatus TaxID=2622732 RepID=UPI00209C59B5|nr:MULTISPECIES: HVO_0649 family zinc finger protein [unclassified Haladaptatus]MCO8243031.1 hypothetical protein [Haladaptatus sp. AB643]MCO8252745.1 hypothetical protein [Haladaptatus sp. AB618]